VESALVVDRDGGVLAASAPELVSGVPRRALAEATAGRSSGRMRPADGRRQLEIVVPVRLPIGTYALEVTVQATRVFDEQIADLRRRSLAVLLLGLPVGLPIFYLVGGRALSARHRDALRRSTQDGLTGVGNHRAYQEEVRRQQSVALRRGSPLSLAVIDLDRFKSVNDRSGHRAGDTVLMAVASVFASGRRSDTVFRVGGDEFAVLLPATDLREALTALERLRVEVEGRMLGVTLSVGIAELGPAAPDVVSLWEAADAAVYDAKRSGGNRVVGYDEVRESGVATAQGRALMALLDGEIDVAYQPIVTLDEGTVIGYEALARPREMNGLSGPAEAFAVAEQLGRVGDLDARCREAALERAAHLPTDALLFLNVAPAAFGHPSLDSAALLASIAAAGRTPENIVLEITERSVIPSAVLAQESARLRALGFRLALDDVGAGNAGLEMLRAVPVDIVKVDREVVAAAPTEPGARAVLCAVVAFAAAVGAEVIAEGIETEQMLEHLRDLPRSAAARGRVQAVQGFLIGPPAVVPVRSAPRGKTPSSAAVGPPGPPFRTARSSVPRPEAGSHPCRGDRRASGARPSGHERRGHDTR
jgi:diguanylate cyclase (GGDEF)-like protein